MCNKMAKNYNKFIEDMMESDALLSFVSNRCATIAFKDLDGLVVSAAGLNPGQLCPSTHKVLFQVGARRADRETAIIEMTADQYNNTIRNRMTSISQSLHRSMAWRNYLIDNKLLNKTLEAAKIAVVVGNLYQSHCDLLARAVSQLVPNNHERKVA